MPCLSKSVAVGRVSRGGIGRKRLFLALRYLYIVTAACLVFSQAARHDLNWSHLLMIGMALGSNVQWQRLTAREVFAPLKNGASRDTADGRYKDRKAIYRDLGAITARLWKSLREESLKTIGRHPARSEARGT